MKKWALIVAALYSAVVLVLLYPLTWVAMDRGASLADVGESLVSWQIWVIFVIMLAAQWALLRIPVYVTSRRPITQRPVLITAITAAFMLGVLVLGAGVSLDEFFTRGNGETGPWIAIVLALASWIFWAIYFHRTTTQSGPEATLVKACRFLWTGSILELLIAIPTHIVARQRHYCCAGMMTFIGLTFGLAVMLFAFGPAVYFLFVERWRRTHPQE
jgi:hypothetical protein